MRYSVLLCVALIVCVSAHAVLRDPTPFSINPTTCGGNPCGVPISNDMLKVAQATWQNGQSVQITWALVASDGAGDVTGVFDPNGGTAFTGTSSVQAWTPALNTAWPGQQKLYTQQFSVPNTLSCANSPTGLCTLRIGTGSWCSCTMVNITKTNPGVVKAPQTTCSAVTAGSTTFCTTTNTSLIRQGYKPTDIDTELQVIYDANLGNPKVFGKGTDPTCKSDYRTFLCALNMPACNLKTNQALAESQACRAQCRATMTACALQEAHVSLYDCESLPLCPGEPADAVTGSGKSSGMSGGGKAALAIFFIALAGIAGFAGYTYHKQGHLFGYQVGKGGVTKIGAGGSTAYNYAAYVDNERI